MLDLRKNDLIDATLSRYYVTYSTTLDTADFVPVEVNAKIFKYITKNLMKSFKRIDKDYKALLKAEKIKSKYFTDPGATRPDVDEGTDDGAERAMEAGTEAAPNNGLARSDSVPAAEENEED